MGPCEAIVAEMGGSGVSTGKRDGDVSEEEEVSHPSDVPGRGPCMLDVFAYNRR